MIAKFLFFQKTIQNGTRKLRNSVKLQTIYNNNLQNMSVHQGTLAFHCIALTTGECMCYQL